jgi:hypothetical protein
MKQEQPRPSNDSNEDRDANGELLEIAVTVKVFKSSQDTPMVILQLETLVWDFQVQMGLVARC